MNMKIGIKLLYVVTSLMGILCSAERTPQALFFISLVITVLNLLDKEIT